MVMYFQDDFWEAIRELPEQDREAAAMALLEYHFEGEVTTTNPVALAILTVSKKRIDLSKTRSKAKKGKTKAASSENQNEIKTKSKPNQTETSPSLSLSLSNSKSIPNENDAVDWDNPKSEDADFIADALRVFNEETGGDIATLDYVTQCSLMEIRANGRTVDDLRTVVEYKNRQWSGDEQTNSWVRPSTLFARKHFEEYLAEAKRSKGKGVKWDAELEELADALDF